MHIMVTLIIAIVLGAAINISMLNHIPVSALIQYKRTQAAEKGFDSIELSVKSYLNFNRDSDGIPRYPGNGVNINDQIFPQYGFMPSEKFGMVWSVKADEYIGMPSIGICLGAPKDFDQGMSSISANFPQMSVTRGSRCNAQSYSSSGVFLTYWIVIDHMN